jgi:hypothetical protein
VKLISLLFVFLVSFQVSAYTNSELARGPGDSVIQGGVDILPWMVAKPFPWDDISGFWKLGDDDGSFVRAKVLSSTSNRKILSLQVYADGLCSRAYARGTGYIDITEKNVVRAILVDSQYRYQMKLGLFNPKDLSMNSNRCSENVMAVSMQVVGRAENSRDSSVRPIDASMMETHNMLLKKVTFDPSLGCQK